MVYVFLRVVRLHQHPLTTLYGGEHHVCLTTFPWPSGQFLSFRPKSGAAYPSGSPSEFIGITCFSYAYEQRYIIAVCQYGQQENIILSSLPFSVRVCDTKD